MVVAVLKIGTWSLVLGGMRGAQVSQLQLLAPASLLSWLVPSQTW